ncbi:alpha,alpha-trehalase TreF [Sediminicola sp. 1XM1-17]|uniref:alpha,alpha-trehalase TreF n=1 Tax=Sediminicola sp. 1XM1-17 TaxID=3127702 RepID=UPI0030787112
MKILNWSYVLILFLCFSCKSEAPLETKVDFYESQLFKDVQLNNVFKDSKTFVDLVPDRSYQELISLYEQEKIKNDFKLEDFVNSHFSDQFNIGGQFETDTTKNMYQHISHIWGMLTRAPDKAKVHASLIPLPKAYVVPGGRFREIYYWDSYFTIEGLLADKKETLAANMVDNFSHLIDTLGFIPNGTRNYYLSRSQPPFYTLMVTSLTDGNDQQFLEYLPYIEKEYHFWMDGESVINPGEMSKHAVKTTKGTVLNRYWDKRDSPRQESYKEDVHLASQFNTEAEKKNLYSNLRAGAESGWDFSSRWYGEPDNFGSITTTTIAPVDLNCLLFYMEDQLARGYQLKGVAEKAEAYAKKAEARKKAIQDLFWSNKTSYFMDLDLPQATVRDQLTLAGAFPLFFNLATDDQALKVKEHFMNDFLKDGGLLTTLEHSGQQWDAPNGWAPLQWIAVKGLLNYGYQQEAKEIMVRWLELNEKVYANTGKMMEKYNVEDVTLLSGGGEYDLQDGFGWTNGVALGFKQMLDKME